MAVRRRTSWTRLASTLGIGMGLACLPIFAPLWLTLPVQESSSLAKLSTILSWQSGTAEFRSPWMPLETAGLREVADLRPAAGTPGPVAAPAPGSVDDRTSNQLAEALRPKPRRNRAERAAPDKTATAADDATPSSAQPAPPKPAALPAAPAKDGQDASQPAVFSKAAPAGIDDLLAIETRVRELVDRLGKSTVGIQIGAAQGSGVICSADGYVLTAAHVSGAPGRDVTIVLHDGRQVKGKTLGLDRNVDAGLVKIVEGSDWPFVEMGRTEDVRLGDWCLALGHPGGYQKGRPPVVRLGRIVLQRANVVQSDCALVGGDSGGPLFDMQGRVVGIHSRIGPSISWNFHVPVAAYRTGWERMVKSEAWGGAPVRGRALLGVNGEDHPAGCRVTAVPEGLPAHQSGLRVDDIILSLDGRKFDGFEAMAALIAKKNPGDKVKIEFLRGDERRELTIALAARDE